MARTHTDGVILRTVLHKHQSSNASLTSVGRHRSSNSCRHVMHRYWKWRGIIQLETMAVSARWNDHCMIKNYREKKLKRRKCNALIGCIHGAIIAATGRSDCRGDYRELVARLNRCSSPRRSYVVYTQGDWRSDDCCNSCLVYTLQAIVMVTIAPTVVATIAPCIRPITCELRSQHLERIRQGFWPPMCS